MSNPLITIKQLQKKKLPLSFYLQSDVVEVARQLIGKILVTCFENKLTAGRIVETEAYAGIVDKASHAFGNKRTNRTEIMFAKGGVCYVYLCYGVHHLFNVVTNTENTPHAILIRAIEPIAGLEIMQERTKKNKIDLSITKGPGNVSKALGISTKNSGETLLENLLFISNDNHSLKQEDIIATKRIGVDYAAEDALLPYRFIVRNNLFVSGKKSQNISS